MSYINQGNTYGSNSKGESNYNLYNKKIIQPIENDMSYVNAKGEEMIEKAIETKCSTSGQCVCNNNCNCNPVNPTNPDCDFNCAPSNNCCNGQNVPYDPSKAKTVCTYLQVLFDEKYAPGSTLFIPIDTSTLPLVTTTTQLAPVCNNNTTCTLSTSSVFTIDSVKMQIINFSYLFTTLPTTSVLVDGKPVLSLTKYGNGLSAILDPSILNQNCINNGLGTNASVLLNGLASWQFLAHYDICGKVTTNGTTCKFRTTVKNVITSPVTSILPSTFVVPQICVPLNSTTSAPILNATFSATGQLINPVLTPVIDPTNPLNIVVNLSGNLMLTPQVNLQTLQYNKVCFQGMVQ